MINEARKNQKLIKVLLVLMIAAVGSYVLGLAFSFLAQFKNVIAIILVSWLLSFLLDPIVDRIQKYFKLSKILSTSITYLLLTVCIVAIGFIYIPLVSAQIAVLVGNISSYLDSAPVIVNNLNGSLMAQIENSINFIPSIAQFFFSAFIVLTLSFYFIIDQSQINREFFNLLPKDWHDTLKFTQKVINDTFISFFRVQFFYGLSTAVVTWFVMMMFGTGFAVLVGFLSGIFAIVPLVGPLLAIVLPVGVTFISSSFQATIIGVILFLAQQVIFNVVGPKILGKAFSLHPAVILISLLIGLKFGGAFGAVFAIPVLGISVVMFRKFGMRLVRELNKARS